MNKKYISISLLLVCFFIVKVFSMGSPVDYMQKAEFLSFKNDIWINNSFDKSCEPTEEERNFRGANLANQDLTVFNLMYANFEEANLRSAYLINTNFSKANLEFADLEEANLDYANFEEANLYSAYLYKAVIKYTNFTNANLTLAYLIKATIEETSFEGADLESINLYEVNLAKVDLSKAIHLQKMYYKNPFEGAIPAIVISKKT